MTPTRADFSLQPSLPLTYRREKHSTKLLKFTIPTPISTTAVSKKNFEILVRNLSQQTALTVAVPPKSQPVRTKETFALRLSALYCSRCPNRQLEYETQTIYSSFAPI